MASKKSSKNTAVKKVASKSTKQAIADTRKVLNKQAKQTDKAIKANARETAKAQKQAAKNLKVAFKDAKQARDKFGRFLAKLKRDTSGRFVSGKSQPKQQTQKTQPKPTQKVQSKRSSVVPPAQSVPQKPRTAKKIASNKIYTLRDFPYSKGESYAEWMNNLEENRDTIDAQLKPGEKFVGTVFGNKTIIPYENIESLLRKIDQYVEEYDGSKDELISHIGIIKFPTTGSDYRAERDAMLKDRKKASRKTLREAGKELGKTKNETIKLGEGKKAKVARNKTTVELLGESIKANRAKDKRIEELEKQMLSMSEQQKRIMEIMEAQNKKRRKK